MQGLIAFTLRRRVTILMLALAAALVGVIAYVTLPLELLPSGMESVTAFVRIPTQASNPTEVLEQVVRPTEEQIRTIPGIEDLMSGASASGAWMRVTFSPDTDIHLAAAELRDRMERARAQWPDQVRDYRIFRFNPDTDIPILSFAIDLKHYTDEVSFLVEEKVIKPLEALPGVAQVQCWGLLQDQIRIYVDRDRALALNVNIHQLAMDLRKANVEVAGGEVEEGEQIFTVRTDARVHSLAELKSLPVNRQGLRLGEIARIEPAKAVRDRLWLSRNKRSLWCMVRKESTANTVAVADRVRTHIHDVIAKDARLLELGGTIRSYEREDFGLMITGVLQTLRTSASIGAGLAVLVLFFFLRRLRLTLIITLSIPLSLMITLGVIFFSGGTLNVLTMLGITIAIGMLIDNSIVVAENIARHRDLGVEPASAAFRGASEVGLAILLSTLTTVAAFIPLVFMEGQQVAFYVRGMGKPLAISVLASLFVALLFIPLGTVVFYRGSRGRKDAAWRRSALIDGSRSLYARTLELALAHRLRAIVVILAIIGAITWQANRMMPEIDLLSNSGGHVGIGVQLDRNFTLDDSYQSFKTMGNWFEEHMEEYGIEHFWCSFNRTGGNFRLTLKSEDLEFTQSAARRLRADLPPMPGVKLRFGIDDSQGDDKKLNLSIYGPDPNRLLAISREVTEIVERTPGVLGVTCDLEEGQEEVHVVPDREKSLRYGIRPAWLRGTLEYGIRGFWFSDLVQEGREIPMIIEYEGAEERSLGELRDMPIPTQAGRHVPLSNVAEIKMKRGFGDIRRRNGRAQARLVIETGEENQRVVVRRIKSRLEGYELPESYSFKENKGEEIQETLSQMGGTVLLAITFVFLLMGVLFESFVVPLAVIFTIPLSWAGAIWALGFTGTPVDIIGGIGVIVLVGVVVNNGIVLLDCANRFLAEGRGRTEALVLAGRTRFRPILMTAATTVVGLIPMVFTRQGSQISYKALSLTVIGGLVVSTFFTLVFVPILYTILDDLRGLSARTLSQLLPRAARRPSSVPNEA